MYHENGVPGEPTLMVEVIQVLLLKIPGRSGFKLQRGMVHSLLPADVPEKEPNCRSLVYNTVSRAGPRAPEKCGNVELVAFVDRQAPFLGPMNEIRSNASPDSE